MQGAPTGRGEGGDVACCVGVGGGACNGPLRGGAREEMWCVVLPCAGGRMQCAPTGRGEGGDVACRVAVRGGACNAPLRGGAREEMWRVVLPCAGAHAMRPYG